MPYSTPRPSYQPRTWIGAPVSVVARPSNAASLTGWELATVRAAQSPTRTCTGAATAAAVSATDSAVRS